MKISLCPLHSNEITRIIIDPITPVEVCRAKSSSQCSENNIFLLPKVISRKHAIIYEKEAQIFLQDTKSSGGRFNFLIPGTWVNGKRLSKAGVESSPVLIHDNDIIQFGEDTEYDGKIIQAVCFKVGLDHDQIPKVKSLDNDLSSVTSPIPNVDVLLLSDIPKSLETHVSQVGQMSSSVGSVRSSPKYQTIPLGQDRHFSTAESTTKSSPLRKYSLMDSTTSVSLQDTKVTDSSQIYSQDPKVIEKLETHSHSFDIKDSKRKTIMNQILPQLPQLPDHIQEELNLLWKPLDQISIPFREAEIILLEND